MLMPRLINRADWVIALTVVVCSILLFAALALTLSGVVFGGAKRTVIVDFEDATGISIHSRVKFAGAEAGIVSGIRILTPEERLASGFPAQSVRVTLSLHREVPPIPSDSVASIAADTILSDKFVQISAGSPSAPPLEDGGRLASIPATTFDELIRHADTALVAIDSVIQGGAGSPDELISAVGRLVSEAVETLGEARKVVGEVGFLVGEARPVVRSLGTTAKDIHQLVGETKVPLQNALVSLESAATSLESATLKGDKLIDQGGRALSTTTESLQKAIADLNVTIENAKVASTYAKILARRLTQRPSQLIWGPSRVPPLPSESEILRSKVPLPDGLRDADE